MNELLRRILFLPTQASSESAHVDALHYFVILTTMAGAGLVTLVGGYFIIRYRRRPGAGAMNPSASAKPPIVFEMGAVVGLFGLFLTWWYIGAREYVRLR